MWEWERLRQTPYQIDAWLPAEVGVLYVRERITNPGAEEVPILVVKRCRTGDGGHTGLRACRLGVQFRLR
jgi:hypothetical protein